MEAPHSRAGSTVEAARSHSREASIVEAAHSHSRAASIVEAAPSQADSPTMEETQMPDSEGSQVSESVKILASAFLEKSHYERIHQALAAKWDKLQSLSAAMKLMEEHGVVLTEAEVSKLSHMDEMQQINALVMKMPQQSNEQFQRFFLQLQLLVSAATRVRRALEEGRPDLVDEALADAESSGISSYIVRMAIVQAGVEVKALKASYNAWVKDADARMGRLIRGQEDCMQAQKKLAAAQAQFQQFTTGQNEKAKKVLMSFAAGSSTGLLASCFNGWLSHVKAMKQEGAIYKEYEEAIERAEQRLVDYKATQMANVRGVMNKRAAANEAELLVLTVKGWREIVEDKKLDDESKQKLAALEDKLNATKSTLVANTKKVMARMGAGEDANLVAMVFKAFVTFHQDYQKNKIMEDQVKAAERQVQDFLKSKSDSAKKVLDGMSATTESGLVKTCIQAWIVLMEERRQENEMAELLEGANSKMATFGERNKKSARNVSERARLHAEAMVTQYCFGSWKLDTRMEMTVRKYHEQIDAKRKQLLNVQQMFRNFAQQLESGLKRDDTVRDLHNIPPQKKKLIKSDATVSLPDISHKPSSVRSSHRRTPSGADSGR